jgi:hypothetical protein
VLLRAGEAFALLRWALAATRCYRGPLFWPACRNRRNHCTNRTALHASRFEEIGERTPRNPICGSFWPPSSRSLRSSFGRRIELHSKANAHSTVRGVNAAHGSANTAPGSWSLPSATLSGQVRHAKRLPIGSEDPSNRRANTRSAELPIATTGCASLNQMKRPRLRTNCITAGHHRRSRRLFTASINGNGS